METKTFEIRDEGTHIPMLFIQLTPRNNRDRYILARAGYGETADGQSRYILGVGLIGGEGRTTSDPLKWGNGRTRQVAHQYIIENWWKLENGAVIDVEFILGMTSSPKRSEAEPPHA